MDHRGSCTQIGARTRFPINDSKRQHDDLIVRFLLPTDMRLNRANRRGPCSHCLLTPEEVRGRLNRALSSRKSWNERNTLWIQTVTCRVAIHWARSE